ncbi:MULTISPECIES: FBP domain-containing protein [Actinosynnema]|uniref:Elongation factor G-binding protein C-terminal treble-clef zinc-finger domain-containing protein n=1 Tax=Actinosynnema pretiosum TaxID=42197 RepID=A0A290Z9P6_9PSEU|nr:FBP domain-containing protein [Actinosynnema pretiosum]ATE55702.1 hypothetical protein CNX65_22425 [Actinosynnema pretiosum]
MRPAQAEEIRRCFANCSKGEAKKLSLPPGFESTDWASTDFLGWTDPRAVNNAYLVLPRGDDLVGIALRANQARAGALRRSVCAFCVTTHAMSDVVLFAAPKAGASGRNGNTVGTYACAELGCSSYVRGKARPAVPQPGESATLEERLARMLGNIGLFVDRVLEA